MALIFVHDEARFEVWLVGFNKQVQKEYWEVLRQCDYCEHRVPKTTQGVLSIAEHVLTENPDFDDPETLTIQIEGGMLQFIERIEHILSQCID